MTWVIAAIPLCGQGSGVARRETEDMLVVADPRLPGCDGASMQRCNGQKVVCDLRTGAMGICRTLVVPEDLAAVSPFDFRSAG